MSYEYKYAMRMLQQQRSQWKVETHKHLR